VQKKTEEIARNLTEPKICTWLEKKEEGDSPISEMFILRICELLPDQQKEAMLKFILNLKNSMNEQSII